MIEPCKEFNSVELSVSSFRSFVLAISTVLGVTVLVAVVVVL
jgi:hypothetical protein